MTVHHECAPAMSVGGTYAAHAPCSSGAMYDMISQMAQLCGVSRVQIMLHDLNTTCEEYISHFTLVCAHNFQFGQELLIFVRRNQFICNNLICARLTSYTL